MTMQPQPPPVARCDHDEIVRAVNAMTAIGRGGVSELRALNASVYGDRRTGTYSGYFNSAEALAKTVATISKASGVYVVVNDVDHRLLARAENRIRLCGKGDQTTSDKDITARRFLLIDCDAERPAGIAASDEEHELALERARAIHADLWEQRWGDGLLADSGNGGHLIYPISGVGTLADDDLVKRCLLALDDVHGDAMVKVDASVFNPARIWKLYGTPSCKGDNTPDRPHRTARILHVPDNFGQEQVTREQLEQFADAFSPNDSTKPLAAATAIVNGDHRTNTGLGAFDLEGFIARNLEVRNVKAYDKGGQLWEIICPFNPEHKRGEAFVIRRADGVIQAGCHHVSCQHWDWHDLRAKCEPKQPRQEQRERTAATTWQEYYAQRPEPPDQVAGQSFQFEWLTSAELADCNEDVEYLIDNVVTRAQGGIVSGVFKTLKTGVAVDLFTSLATGTPFLGYFDVSRALPCGLMSAEIGKAGLRARANEVAAAKGYDPHHVPNLHFSTACPNVANLEHTDALERFVEEKQLAMLGIDPSYLAFCEVGDKASNYIAMGKLLIGLTRLIDKTRCSIILINHNRHGRGTLNRFAPPELGEISFAGFAEWARFWLLLGARQDWNEERGEHWLWLRTGGSAGHAGLHHLNVVEGKRTDPEGRRWQAEVLPASEGNKQDEEQREAQREARHAERVQRAKEKIIKAMARHPNGDSQKAIRITAGLDGGQVTRDAFSALISDGDLVPCQIQKGNRRKPEDGFKLADRNDE
jgi:hypothetical protein